MVNVESEKMAHGAKFDARGCPIMPPDLSAFDSISISFIDPYERCPVCNSGDLTSSHALDLNSEARVQWSRCRDCGLTFQNPRLSETSLRALYEHADYFGLHSNKNRAGAYADFLAFDPMRIKQGHRRITRIVELSGVRGGRLLDVASASGFFGVAARDAGFEVTCIEPHAEMAALGHEKYGLAFMVAQMEDCAFVPESYDIVTIWGAEGLFLHPVRSIQKLVDALRPGGILALNYHTHDHWIRRIFPRLMRGWNVVYTHTNRSFDTVLGKLKMELIAREIEWQTVTVDHVGRVLRITTSSHLKHVIVRVPVISMPLAVARKRES